MKSQDKAFAAATIQAIGRCATNISEVTDTCLNGLVLLLSNRDGKMPLQISAVACLSCSVYLPQYIKVLRLPGFVSLQRRWWLRVWWWSRSCFRRSPPSTVKSSNTWPSSSTTSPYDSSLCYLCCWSICICSTWQEQINECRKVLWALFLFYLSPKLEGPHGSSQHPVADGRVLREGAKDCTWCTP